MEIKQRICLSCPCMSSPERYFSNFEMNQIIQCHLCKKYQHKLCMKNSINIKPNYICPKCQINKNDPYLEQIQSLSQLKIIYFSNLNFNFINQNQNILTQFSIDIQVPKIQFTKNNFIIITCLQLEENGFKYQWPGDFNLKVNGIQKNCIRNINKLLKKKLFIKCTKETPDNKLYKTSHFYLENFFNYGKNILNLTFSWTKKTINNTYVISVDLVNLLTKDIVLKNIPIKEYSNSVTGNISEKINFIEPYSQIDFIKIPVKGINCVHLQCFDCESFLIQNAINQLFKCPICKKTTGPIFLDIKMNQLLEKYKGKLISINDNYEIIEINNDLPQKKNVIEINDDINDNNDDIIEIINDNEKKTYNDNKYNNEVIEILNDDEINDINSNKKNKNEKLKFNCVLIKIDKKKFPFYKEFDKNINIEYIKNNISNIVIPEFENILEEHLKEYDDEKNLTISSEGENH